MGNFKHTCGMIDSHVYLNWQAVSYHPIHLYVDYLKQSVKHITLGCRINGGEGVNLISVEGRGVFKYYYMSYGDHGYGP